MTTIEETAAKAVAAGMVWLDENAPGWRDKIDIEALDVADCQLCVLGQIYGDYSNAPPSARYGENAHWADADAAADWLAPSRGFDHGWADRKATGDRSFLRYANLNEAWRKALR